MFRKGEQPTSYELTFSTLKRRPILKRLQLNLALSGVKQVKLDARWPNEHHFKTTFDKGVPFGRFLRRSQVCGKFTSLWMAFK